jgi:hypothetical protein
MDHRGLVAYLCSMVGIVGRESSKPAFDHPMLSARRYGVEYMAVSGASLDPGGSRCGDVRTKGRLDPGRRHD